MIDVTKNLKHIYKASQCADVDDCDIALNQINTIVRMHKWTPALIKRFNSITKVKERILNN